jgi:alpha-galactosidase
MKSPYCFLVAMLAATSVSAEIVWLDQLDMADVWSWGGSVNGNCWRTTDDITDTWQSLSGIGFKQDQAAPYSKPGNWNGPDMLVVGVVALGPTHPTRLTADEQYTHISLWCLLSAPLLIGCDMTKLDNFALNLLSNDEVLAVDQDELGKQATCVLTNGDVRIYEKELADGGRAVGFFNL